MPTRQKYLPIVPTAENYRLAYPSDDLPKPPDDIPVAGISTEWSRADHRHPATGSGAGLPRFQRGNMLIAGPDSPYADVADVVFGKTEMVRRMMGDLFKVSTGTIEGQYVDFKYPTLFNGDINEFAGALIFIYSGQLISIQQGNNFWLNTICKVLTIGKDTSDYCVYLDSDGYFHLKFNIYSSLGWGDVQLVLDAYEWRFYLDKTAEVVAKLDELFPEDMNRQNSARNDTLLVSGRIDFNATQTLKLPAKVIGLENNLVWNYGNYNGSWDRPQHIGNSSINFATTRDSSNTWGNRYTHPAISFRNYQTNNIYDIVLKQVGLFRTMSSYSSTDADWFDYSSQGHARLEKVQIFSFWGYSTNFNSQKQGWHFEIFDSDLNENILLVSQNLEVKYCKNEKLRFSHQEGYGQIYVNLTFLEGVNVYFESSNAHDADNWYIRATDCNELNLEGYMGLETMEWSSISYVYIENCSLSYFYFSGNVFAYLYKVFCKNNSISLQESYKGKSQYILIDTVAYTYYCYSDNILFKNVKGFYPVQQGQGYSFNDLSDYEQIMYDNNPSYFFPAQVVNNVVDNGDNTATIYLLNGNNYANVGDEVSINAVVYVVTAVTSQSVYVIDLMGKSAPVYPSIATFKLYKNDNSINSKNLKLNSLHLVNQDESHGAIFGIDSNNDLKVEAY